MEGKYVVLFVRKDSLYKKRPAWECWDKERDALHYTEKRPVVCHPPCRLWGKLASFVTRAKENEKELSVWAVNKVRKVGGIIEHPVGSKLFKPPFLPKVGETDEFGGFTLKIDQFDFGHVAHKPTLLYFKGIKKEDLPVMPEKNTTIAKRSISGEVPGTKTCTQYQREYTPDKLIDFFEIVLDKIQKNKNDRDGKEKIKRPALKYFGNKWTIAPWIIGFFPEHKHYIEPFGGSASVLLQKQKSSLETYNDRFDARFFNWRCFSKFVAEYQPHLIDKEKYNWLNNSLEIAMYAPELMKHPRFNENAEDVQRYLEKKKEEEVRKAIRSSS